jgi:hypothetical protein
MTPLSPLNQAIHISDGQAKALYRVAGTMAVLIVIAGLIDVLTSMGVEARDNRTVSILEWFALFQTHRFAAFSRLGVINITTVSLCIPVYLAFNQAYRRDRPALVAFASILFFVAAAVYLASNTVFSIFALSQQYLAAPDAYKPVLEVAGRALLAQGADLTPGTFVGLFLVQIAGLVMTGIMLRGTVFSKWTGRVGLVGFSLMAVFFVLTAFVPERYATAMLLAAPGGLFLMAYQLLLARRFFQLGRHLQEMSS